MDIKDIYILPQTAGNLVYAPLHGIVFAANEEFSDRLRHFLDTGHADEAFQHELETIGLLDEKPQGPIDIDKRVDDAIAPSSMIFLFSDSCNLRCKYCFASAGDVSTAPFDEQMAKDAVRFVIQNAASRNEECVISFHGGGEPTYDFHWLRQIVHYGKDTASEYGIADKTSFMIVTNGFMSDARAIWLSNNMTRVQVSIDGYADIQNDQRPAANGAPTFERVFRTVKILEAGNAQLVVRATISKKNQHHLAAITKFFCENIDVDRFYYGTVNNYGRAAQSEYCEPEAAAFISSLIESQNIAQSYGKRVIACSAQDNFPNIAYEYCGATVPIFGLTKSGRITACPEVISEDDARKDIFWYGKFDPVHRKFIMDSEKIIQLVSYQAKDTTKCIDCFAKFQCAGDCRARWYSYETGKQILDEDFRCTVNRQLVERKMLDCLTH